MIIPANRMRITPANTMGNTNFSVPNVADVLEGWLTTINAAKVTKDIVDGEVVETLTPLSFTAMIQPYSQIELQVIVEGERHWEWVKVYTQFTDLKVDDIVIIKSTKYRIMAKMPYEQFGYGYYRYNIVNDFTDGVLDNDNDTNADTSEG